MEIPYEIKIEIVDYLDVKSIIRVGLVDKTFYSITNLNQLWKKIFINKYGIQACDKGICNYKDEYKKLKMKVSKFYIRDYITKEEYLKINKCTSVDIVFAFNDLIIYKNHKFLNKLKIGDIIYFEKKYKFNSPRNLMWDGKHVHHIIHAYFNHMNEIFDIHNFNFTDNSISNFMVPFYYKNYIDELISNMEISNSKDILNKKSTIFKTFISDFKYDIYITYHGTDIIDIKFVESCLRKYDKKYIYTMDNGLKERNIILNLNDIIL